MDGFEGGGKTLKDAGAILADDLFPKKQEFFLCYLCRTELRILPGFNNFLINKIPE
ncbi:MAG: hypothetical protein R6U27_08070 [Desulfobacterales bacterium]